MSFKMKKLCAFVMLASTLSITGCNSSSNQNTALNNANVNQKTNVNSNANSKTNSQNAPDTTEKTDVSAKTKTTLESLEKQDWKLLNAQDSNFNKIALLTNNKEKISLNFKRVNNKPALDLHIGCNQHTADYQLSNNALTISNINGTDKSCDSLEPVKKQLLDFLIKESQLAVTKAGINNILTMTLPDGTNLLWEGKTEKAYQAQNDALKSTLRKYDWKLYNATAQNSPVDSFLHVIKEFSDIKENVKLNFGDNTVKYGVGCNDYGAQFELVKEGQLSLSNFTATEIACDEAEKKAEVILHNAMKKGSKLMVKISATPELKQTTINTDGSFEILTWYGMPKPTTDVKAMLKKHDWQLKNALKQDSPADSRLSAIPEIVAHKDKTKLSFSFTPIESSVRNTHSISYTAGCNNHTGDFVLDQDDVLSVSEVQMTEKACVDGTSTAETMLNDIIKEGGKLVVATNAGKPPELTYTTKTVNGAFKKLIWEAKAK